MREQENKAQSSGRGNDEACSTSRVEEYSASERTAEVRVVFLEGRDEELDHLVVLRAHTTHN